jgi:hypothetical protein
VVERKAVLNEQHHPLEIDIWDQSRISEMLRDKPEVVIKYFGPQTADRFCVPHVLTPVEIPSPDAVATADAVLLGPLISTDAQRLVDRANEIAADDPDAALTLYREVQSRLTAAGFPGHAAEFDNVVVALSIRTGQADTAIRPLMDALWAAEGKGDSRGVDRVVGRLRDLADLPAFGPTQNKVPRARWPSVIAVTNKERHPARRPTVLFRHSDALRGAVIRGRGGASVLAGADGPALINADDPRRGRQ